MAFQAVNDRQFLESVARTVALRRAHREIKMLRALLPKDQVSGTMHCSICFRDVPHTEDSHKTDEHYLKHLDPEILADINK